MSKRKPETVILTNMCMVYDDDGNILVQDRVDKHWSGITFPGGHVENGESFLEAVIREVREETGLQISHVQMCGIKYWMTDDNCRYMVICYKTKHFEGTLTSSGEGNVFWIRREEFEKMPLASGMENTIRVFLEDDITEHYCWEEDGQDLNVVR